MYKSIIFVVSAIAATAFAQSVPTCAQPCIVLPASCGTNATCICTDQEWISGVSCCVFNSCSASDQSAALAYAQTVCTPVGATLPSVASCPASSTSSGSGSETATSAAATGSAASSAASSGSSVVASITSSASSAISSASSAASSAASSSAFAGLAAHQVAIPAGGVLGAIIGAAALL